MASKEEWLALVDQEEGEALVLQLIHEIIQRSQHVLFEKHIDVQVLPYAVDFARDALIDLIDFKFFRRDPGNVDMDLWEPDEEPEPAVIDSWARGAVPVRTLSPNAVRTHRKRGEEVKADINTAANNAAAVATNTATGTVAASVVGGNSSVGGRTHSTFARAAEPIKSVKSFNGFGFISETNRKSKMQISGRSKSMVTMKNSSIGSPTKRDTPTRDTIGTGLHDAPGTSASHASVSVTRHANNATGSASTHQPILSGSSAHSYTHSAHAAAAAAIAASAITSSTANAADTVPPPELQIQEENKRMLARIRNIQKDGGKVDIAFDHEGRVVMMNRFVPGKLLTQGVRAKIVTDESQVQGAGVPAGAGPVRGPRARFEAVPEARGDASTSAQNDAFVGTRVSFRAHGASNASGASGSVMAPLPPSDGRPPLRSTPRHAPRRSQRSDTQSHTSTTQQPIAAGSHVAQAHGSNAAVTGSATLASTGQALAQDRDAIPSAMFPELTSGIDTYIEDPSLEIPPLVDVMKLAPGVTLKEGENVRKGPPVSRKVHMAV